MRLECLAQPEGPYLTVASAKPEDDDAYPNGFYIRNNENALWLRGYRADDLREHPKDNEFFLSSPTRGEISIDFMSAVFIVLCASCNSLGRWIRFLHPARLTGVSYAIE